MTMPLCTARICTGKVESSLFEPYHDYPNTIILSPVATIKLTYKHLFTMTYFFSFSKNPSISIPSFLATDRVVCGCDLGGSFCFFAEPTLEASACVSTPPGVFCIISSANLFDCCVIVVLLLCYCYLFFDWFIGN